MFKKTDLVLYVLQTKHSTKSACQNLSLFVPNVKITGQNHQHNSYYLTELGNVRTALLMIYRLDIIWVFADVTAGENSKKE